MTATLSALDKAALLLHFLPANTGVFVMLHACVLWVWYITS